MNFLFQRVHQLDTSAFLWIHSSKKLTYRKSIRYLSHTGDGHIYVVAALLLWAFESEHGAVFASACALAYGLEVSLYLMLKNLIKRDRPAIKIDSYKAWIKPSDQFSFPSGHTAAAFVFASLMMLFYPSYAPIFYLWASLIGLSRVLLGVHFPTDIAAGAMLGSACALAGFGLMNVLI